MANPQYATTSNNPELDDSQIETLERLLDAYVYGVGPMESTEAELRGDPPYLFLGGYAPLGPIVRKSRFSDASFSGDTRYEEDDTVEFLYHVSQFIHEPFVIQTVSHTKLRWPAGASMYRVEPDGSVTHSWFNTSGKIEQQEYDDIPNDISDFKSLDDILDAYDAFVEEQSQEVNA